MDDMKHRPPVDEPFVRLWKECVQAKYPLFPTLNLKEYPRIKVFLHDTGAGKLPVIFADQRGDFERIFCDVFYQGQQKALPPSMGAVMMKGLRDMLGINHRIILISNGYYSNISSEHMGLNGESWKEKSAVIRLHHEATHYYTLRQFGFADKSIIDEFIADAMGILAAFGYYKAEYFLRFMGLEQYPEYRSGGRLENYLPKDNRVGALQEMGKKAYNLSTSLEQQLQKHKGVLNTGELLIRLCENAVKMKHIGIKKGE